MGVDQSEFQLVHQAIRSCPDRQNKSSRYERIPYNFVKNWAAGHVRTIDCKKNTPDLRIPHLQDNRSHIPKGQAAVLLVVVGCQGNITANQWTSSASVLRQSGNPSSNEKQRHLSGLRSH